MKLFLGIFGGLVFASFCIWYTLYKNDAAANGSLNNPALEIKDIRGDTLGMSLHDYEKRHPSGCFLDRCTGYDTYAGMSALKSAEFSHGRLYQVYYSVDALVPGELLNALKQKYGDPGCLPGKGHGCRWSNGKATVRYLDLGNKETVEFVLDDLAAQAAKEFEKQKADKVSTDQ